MNQTNDETDATVTDTARWACSVCGKEPYWVYYVSHNWIPRCEEHPIETEGDEDATSPAYCAQD